MARYTKQDNSENVIERSKEWLTLPINLIHGTWNAMTRFIPTN